MKEFEISLQKHLTIGLRPSNQNPINSPGLIQCHNLRVGKESLENIPAIYNPFVGQLTLDWPFPCFIKRIGPYAIYTRKIVYEVDSLWNLTKKFTSSVEPTSRWNSADYGDFEVILGGGVNLLRSTTGVYSKATSTEIPNCASGCDLRGQLILCDLDEGSNWVSWSEIGSLSFDVGRSNIAGKRVMPWQGPLWKMLPIDFLKTESLSNSRPGAHNYGVVVYGAKGIGYLQAVDSPHPTFKLDKLLDFGMASRFAAGGNLEQHLMIDERGYLRSISNKGVRKLDYLEFFQPLIGEDFIITRDDTEDQWWIADGEHGFLLAAGLSTTDYVVSDGFSDEGTFIAVHNNPTITEAYFLTDTIDMGVKAKKSIETVILRAETDGSFEGCVHWRNAPTDPFVAGPTFPIVRGLGHTRVTGTDFRIYIKVKDHTYVRFHDLALRWKLSDKTNIRGQYVNSSNTRTDR